MSIDDAKQGDVFVTRDRRGWLHRVTIERLTKTMLVDTKGGRWLKRNGASVGGSEWDKSHIEPMTDKHRSALARQRQVVKATKALDALTKARAYAVTHDPEPLIRALPHLEAAVAALQEAP